MALADRSSTQLRTRMPGLARLAAAILLAALCLGPGTEALSQTSSRKIPIQRDLERIPPRADEAGALDPAVRAQSDPTGVAGFSGPPGIIGESVGSYSPLPPGAPGNEEW